MKDHKRSLASALGRHVMRAFDFSAEGMLRERAWLVISRNGPASLWAGLMTQLCACCNA